MIEVFWSAFIVLMIPAGVLLAATCIALIFTDQDE